MMAGSDGPVMVMAAAAQPVVILGGFLITNEAYAPMASWIESHLGAEVRVVPASRFDWMLTSWAIGWRRLLDRVHHHVGTLARLSPTGQVTLIGHSSGGVMLRLYLSDEPFSGRTYGGASHCNQLITLGSPHQAQRGTPLRLMVDRKFPGTPCSDVDYLSIAGTLDLGSANASVFSRRSAAGSYRSIAGTDGVEGDGLVPVSSALLANARHLILPDTAHGGLFGRSWYGSEDRLGLWTDQIGR